MELIPQADDLAGRAGRQQLDIRQRDAAVGDFVDLIGTFDTVLQLQARADAAYFAAVARTNILLANIDRIPAAKIDATV